MSYTDKSSSMSESVREATGAYSKKVRETKQEATEDLASNQNAVIDGSNATEEGGRDFSAVRGVTPSGPEGGGCDGSENHGEGGEGGEGGEAGGQRSLGTAFTGFTPFFDRSTNVSQHVAVAAEVVNVPGCGLHEELQFDDDVLTHQASENPVVTKAKEQGLYKTPLGSGMHEIKCPWGHEHANPVVSSATYTEPDEYQPLGAFRCKEACHAQLTAKDLLEKLGIPKMAARNKPVIRNIPGDLHAVVDASELVLARRGKFYQSGNVIVSVTTDPATGNPAITPMGLPALTRELSAAASWEKEESRTGLWRPCDPPSRHVNVLHNATEYRYLSALAGVARQPYFSESDESLIVTPGYNEQTHIFGVFDPAQFPLPEPTLDSALLALQMLSSPLREFHFASGHDKSAMLSAMFTATLRASLAHAPGFHVKAHELGSGKSYACELISAFASPAPSEKVSYPTTSEEATKVILSLLLKNPAVIEFDDMDEDWIAHGAFKRMLTAEYVTDRILGHSKTATVRTRVLFLGSGNNVGPKDDMRRRVVTINLDPKCATPSTISYAGSPVELVRQNRGAYVAAVLTIVQAWIKSGKPRSPVKSIATYGAWSDYCRQALMWLGLPDPATSLLDQVTNDPDSDPLAEILHAWKGAFGTTATTVRRAIETVASQATLDRAVRDCMGNERGPINPTKFGWFLKRHAGRVVGGLRFAEDSADGRKAWKVVVIDEEAFNRSNMTPSKSADVSDKY